MFLEHRKDMLAVIEKTVDSFVVAKSEYPEFQLEVAMNRDWFPLEEE